MTTRVGDIRAQIEQKIGQTGNAHEGETGGMYLAARLVKQKIAATSKGMTSSSRSISETSPTKQKARSTTSNKPSSNSRPPHSPSKTSRFRNNNGPANQSTYGDKGGTDFSVTSRTTCASDTECSSGEFIKPTTTPTVVRPSTTTSSSSPMRNPAKDRVAATKRASICQKRFVDIPQSIDEEKEELVGCTIVMCDIDVLEGSMCIMNLDDEEVGSNFSPRHGSMVSRSNNMDESEQSINSRGSTLSRSSPQILRLPRDVDFDSDDSSMSDDDSAGLAKHRQKQQRVRKPLPKPRYW